MNAPWHPDSRSGVSTQTLSVSKILIPALIAFSTGCSLLQADGQEPATNASGSAEKGQEVYSMYCAACHGASDSGIDSPSNLFDKNWRHGGKRSEIEKTIREGVMENGMPAWGQMIPNEEIQSVIAYLITFQSTENSENE